MSDEKEGEREAEQLAIATEGPDAPAARLLRARDKTKPSAIFGESHAIWQGDVLEFLKGLPVTPLFDLIVTSPPYNIGKSYETRQGLDEYIAWQETIVDELVQLYHGRLQLEDSPLGGLRLQLEQQARAAG